MTISYCFVITQETLPQIYPEWHNPRVNPKWHLTCANPKQYRSTFQHYVVLLTQFIPQSSFAHSSTSVTLCTRVIPKYPLLTCHSQSQASYTCHFIHIILHVSALSHITHVPSSEHILHESIWVTSYTCRPLFPAYMCRAEVRPYTRQPFVMAHTYKLLVETSTC